MNATNQSRESHLLWQLTDGTIVIKVEPGQPVLSGATIERVHANGATRPARVDRLRHAILRLLERL